VKGIDHLVLAGRDLEAMRACYRSLGFTLTPPARHPFGTGNSLVQLDRCFLELLAVIDPAIIPEHGGSRFSFAAFNRDFLADREGFSMLVLDSIDARAEVARLQEAGIATYEPFDFERKANLPSGEEVTVGFSLAFATHPQMPKAGFFTCEQRAPQHFWKPEYQRHANTAATVLEVCLVANDPSHFQDFISGFTGVAPSESKAVSSVRPRAAMC
jgi:Glyoxalase-like domain